MPKVDISSLVLDFDIYPRNEVSSQQVRRLCDAIEVGDELPPIVADKASKRVIDGFHRVKAYERMQVEKVSVSFRQFGSEAELFAECVKLNACHGRPLDSHDYRRAVLKMKDLGIESERISEITRLPVGRIEELTKQSTGDTSGNVVPLKRGLMHLQGRRLNKKQRDVVERASGMAASFHARQLRELLEADLAQMTENLVEEMDKLCSIWEERRPKMEAG